MKEMDPTLVPAEESPTPVLVWAVDSAHNPIRAWAIYSPERSGWLVTRLNEHDSYFGRYEPGSPDVLPPSAFLTRGEAAAAGLDQVEAWLRVHDTAEAKRRAEADDTRQRILRTIERLEAEVING